ncbi:MAG: hypothetical protein C0402_01070 [Thermodesulfovibrio sp.]|nr:hypothetical protein [Thermodesulfovibrio sp.]
MKKNFWLICLLVFISTVSFSAVWAEEKKADAKTPDAKQKAELSKKADLFVQVAAYGEEQKDPMLMLSAVKMMDELPFKGIEKPGDKTGALYSRDAMLKQAKEFAAGDTELLAVIAKVQDAPETTDVRYRGGHRERHGHGRDYHGGHHYYERRHHDRYWGCTWRFNRFGDWVCR